ncbi:MAG: PPOX class F420-dependent oxidoreductase [Chloroflexi bacterium]|nr:PPOX class F420-dependent oxidoreductase [Chloroflexota bacterium]MCI0577654.1 PPOX class F420-dependent oxidoreductase [Chloroflexota bacterium]MCI0644871.1 PPOX class F420-dependent oxidoreductase [Chloroflexota bacterium]MCI0725827.1 PPOX class F420-dependent oxidoreductase [Chloroflexota bacterium]
MIGRLAQFSGSFFATLETYRRDGTAVRTPLFFVERDEVLYLRSAAQTHKVRRIARDPRVRIVPSAWRGRPLGVWLEGEARLYDAGELPWVNELVKQKYGLAKRLIDLRSRLRGYRFVVIAVVVGHR